LKSFYKYLFVILFFYIFFPCIVQAQDIKEQESELISKANDCFVKKDYLHALSKYSRLLELKPEIPLYNYRYGVCALSCKMHADNKTIKYLEFAAEKMTEEIDVYYYLGIAYHLNYRFPEAIVSFEKFKEKANEFAIEQFAIEKNIKINQDAINLLDTIWDYVALKKMKILKNDFFKVYDLTGMAGDFRMVPKELKSKIDIEKNEESFGFFSNNQQTFYFSSYGKKITNRKDIYKSSLELGGKWSTPQKLDTTINTSFDDDYPFITPDEKTLYFCSKGHNSMGGYDIFISNFDSTKNVWISPINLNFPINSPFDDILFVSGSEINNAYFSSVRNCEDDQIFLYEINSSDFNFIMGNLSEVFNSQQNENSNQNKYQNIIKLLKEVDELNLNKSYSDLIESINKNDIQIIVDENKINNDTLIVANKLDDFKIDTSISKQDSIEVNILAMIPENNDTLKFFPDTQKTIITKSLIKDSLIAIATIEDTLINQTLVDTTKIFVEEKKSTPKPIDTIKINPPSKLLIPNSDIFFTIRAGVFSKIKTSAQLNYIPDIFYEITQNGHFKYFSGHYKDFAETQIALKDVRSKGFKDAFIVAFKGKNKISVSKANAILNSKKY